MNNNYVINCDGNVFDRAQQESHIAGTPVVLDQRTSQAVTDAETLDRYDDFSSLKLGSSLYRRAEGSTYGIPHIWEIHGNGGVILDHQLAAAYAFLHELRGFGLLADVVGSGKTFEAGIVLSELAARGKLKSLLVVVPEQVYSSWVNVLENYFGMGVGSLHEVGTQPRFEDKTVYKVGNKELARPARPVIVKTEDFVKWTERDIRDLIFDVVVVDEAHHLCSEEGEYALALKFLSILMQNKKLVNSTYCLLLSATPHSGNLEKMFRLWYFIRCKGGFAKDFDEKDDSKRTTDYVTEKKYYQEVVCRGAHTVSEYITICKKRSIDQRFSREFAAYLEKTGRSESFEKLTDWEKQKVRNDFLHDPANEAISRDVLKDVARGYHNGVMRSIMIRQPNNLPKRKNVHHVFFCPIDGTLPKVVDLGGMKFKPYDPDASDAVVSPQGKSTLSEYLESLGQNNARRKAELWISQVLGSNVFGNKKIFDKDNSQQFYWQQLQEDNAPELSFKLLDNYTRATASQKAFEAKMTEITKILDEKPNERILLFFDYEKAYTKNEGAEWERVYEALKNTRHSARLCLALGDNIKSSEEFFRRTENAVFIIGDPAYTEGSNYQESHVIVNFSVTPDPLAMDQRIGRIFRLGQKFDVDIYSFAVMNELEGYALAYFNRIGLLSSNSGDATIIAGSNNERMVAVQCPACGKMLLYPSDEFATRKLNKNLYCDDTHACRQDDPKGTEMQEINIYEFKCDKCGENLARTESEGYRCFSVTSGTRGKLINVAGSGNRTYACSKLCAIHHCSRIKGFKNRCKLLDLPESTGIAQIKLTCYRCPNQQDGTCPAKCSMLFDNSLEAIKSCRTCDYSSCSPHPHSFDFDDKWVAPCPKCNGHLRPVLAHTFAAYIRASFAFNDGGRSFCNNLMQEANHVADIRNVLKSDEQVKYEISND